MSLEEKAEENLYRAIDEMCRIPRPNTKERVFKNVVEAIMRHMGWPTVTIETKDKL